MYRVRDIFLSLLLLTSLSGLFLLIMLLLVLTQKRVFFIQERTGKGEKSFRLVKFSTLRDILPGENEADDQQKRLTPIGKILRKLSLDELPQLFNVLKGEMSLIGPRPLLASYLPLYSATQKKRFLVRPGITGWAQINGRNRISFTKRFELDVWYVEHRSFWLDLKILLLTPLQIFKSKEVYQDAKTTMEPFDGTN